MWEIRSVDGGGGRPNRVRIAVGASASGCVLRNFLFEYVLLGADPHDMNNMCRIGVLSNLRSLDLTRGIIDEAARGGREHINKLPITD